MSDSEDEITLPTDTLSILNDFLKNKEERSNDKFEIGEDWQLSQFWYEEETSKYVANVIEQETIGGNVVVCLSTPSIFKVLYKNNNLLLNSHLFEYDNRFAVYKDNFHFYDYRDPLNVPEQFKGNVDFICLDPPFLSEECLEKVCETIKLLRKPTTRLLLLTGRIQWPHIQKLLPEMKICKFEPKHPRLQNDFFCTNNYDSKLLDN
ncbi:hypothetical protein DICPUDRAFT_85979 [Dictyostelium purpureum]|uniref:Protein-lysine N-methyltransferase DICPUDRAFT_85979 n=1 Tax=Dictyostelium purpureum TaxID=5786 RepID=F0Z8N0_DICPU|nr:uncharacterized protein DICPUDRAFT_85979 [Dictyostelium purpureum]EGC39661.1 hypothetical protein DICPUDRAFT_85979 [Dictyostelium purpureum]|eukprot:XP_003283770.1 hypothetical protein DICPUDRAFT_85979 [Dictyostelium purpureum]